jgi:hypothetical protein
MRELRTLWLYRASRGEDTWHAMPGLMVRLRRRNEPDGGDRSSEQRCEESFQHFRIS